MAGVGEGFKALADPTRRRILELLAERDLTAGEIGSHFAISGPSISNHLKILREAGLVSVERQGQRLVYHLETTVFQELMQWFMGVMGVDRSESERS